MDKTRSRSGAKTIGHPSASGIAGKPRLRSNDVSFALLLQANNS
jgi:hypothetical protein